MRPSSSSSSHAARVLAVLAPLITLTSAHTWIEAINHIAANGTLVEPTGYPRGFITRGGPGFTGSEANAFMKFAGPAKDQAGAPACVAAQASPKQAQGFPRLQAAPGDWIAMRYTENGHVTTPDGRTDNKGFVAIYGSTDGGARPKVGDLMAMAADGKLDKGRLVANQSFDDGRCYEAPNNPSTKERAQKFPVPLDGKTFAMPGVTNGQLPCQNDIAIPADAPVGQPLTLYWLWNRTYADPTNKPVELYSQCLDIDVVAPGQSKGVSAAASGSKNGAAAAKFAADQPAVSAAVDVYFKDLASGGRANVQAVGPQDPNAAKGPAPSAAPADRQPSGKLQVPPSAPSSAPPSAAPSAPPSTAAAAPSSAPAASQGPAIPFVGGGGSAGAPVQASTAPASASAPTPSAAPAASGLPTVRNGNGPAIIVADPANPVPPPPAPGPASAAPPAPSAAPAPSASASAAPPPPSTAAPAAPASTAPSAPAGNGGGDGTLTVPASAVQPSRAPIVGTFVAIPVASGGYSVSIVNPAAAAASGPTTLATQAASGAAPAAAGAGAGATKTGSASPCKATGGLRRRRRLGLSVKFRRHAGSR